MGSESAQLCSELRKLRARLRAGRALESEARVRLERLQATHQLTSSESTALLSLDDFLSRRRDAAQSRLADGEVVPSSLESWLVVALARHLAFAGDAAGALAYYAALKLGQSGSYAMNVARLESFSVWFLAAPTPPSGDATLPSVSGHPVLDACTEVFDLALQASRSRQEPVRVTAERAFQLLAFLETVERDARPESFADEGKLTLSREVIAVMSATLLEAIDRRLAKEKYLAWLEERPSHRAAYEERLRWLSD